MKSHAVNEALKPLARLAAEASNRYQAQESIDDARRDRIEAEISAIKADMIKAAKGKVETAIEALEKELVAKKTELLEAQPTERRYMTQDATVEKLGELLRDNPRGMLVSRDELAGWLRTLDKPGREGDREFYLEGWNGTGGYTFDRVGRGTVRIPAVTIALVGGIQPGKLQYYIDEATADGGGADGLLQRVQLSVWHDGVGQWLKVDRWPDKTSRDLAYAVFKALVCLEPPGDGEIPALRFAPDAQALFDAWRDELENRIRSEELAATPTFESHLSKYRSLMPSLALLFHLVNIADPSATFETGVDWRSGEISIEDIPPVSLEAAKLAAAWCDFLEGHARKVYASELAPGVDAAHALATKIKAGDVKDGVTVRSVYERHWSGLATNRQVMAAMDVLASAGWVRLERLDTGGRPSEVFHLHPDLLEGAGGRV
jgi:putative DNA primase/helicase